FQNLHTSISNIHSSYEGKFKCELIHGKIKAIGSGFLVAFLFDLEEETGSKVK
ncbi:hypothetical protein Bpfe_014914, partial [Biomphalaria pfeifferi]